MTSPTDAQIEAVARAIADAQFWDWFHSGESRRDEYRKQARAAILAYEQSKKEP